MNSNIIFKNQKVFITNNKNEMIYNEKPKDEIKIKIDELIKYLEEIFNTNDLSEFSYEKIYFLVLTITRGKGGNSLRENIINLINKVLNDNIKIDDKNFDIENIIEVYENLSEKILKISKLLLYYESNYLKPKNYPSTLQEFRLTFLNNIILKNLNQWQNFIISKLNSAKQVSMILFDFIGIINQIDEKIYFEYFEKEIIENEIKFYSFSLEQILQNTKSFDIIITNIINLYKRELEKIKSNNLNKSLDILITHFLNLIINNFLKKEETFKNFKQYFLNNFKILSELYSLCSISENGKNEFLSILCESIESIYLDYYTLFDKEEKKNKEVTFKFLQNIINLFIKIDENFQLLNLISYIEPKLIYLNKKKIINKKSAIFSKLIPKYIDDLIKSQNFNNEEFDNIISLIKFLNDKDIFEYNYREYFSQRILKSNYNEEQEIYCLTKLKNEFGNFFISKCEKMISDLKASEKFLENLNSFNSELLSQGFKVKMLTMSNWLNIKKNDLMIEMNKFFINEFQNYSFFKFYDEFTIYYKSNHINTIIYYNLFLGDCEIIYNLNLKKYTLYMSPLQAMICFLFNKNKLRKVSLEEILNIFNIKSNQKIIDSIEPLINNKILIKEESDKFILNSNFTSNQNKIIFKTNFEYNIKKNDESHNQIIQNQRKFIIDSKIMTIMKSKKRLSHNELINSILLSLQNDFIPEILTIKNRIESLIERGYLSRKSDYYEYIA